MRTQLNTLSSIYKDAVIGSVCLREARSLLQVYVCFLNNLHGI